ncbi:FAS1 domain-containing protein [Macrolepiota fuliginosa MF-IS2]|uniref:FAS1 domain-containing protein n=1 Tax=Macrolepiota fuliginosa MF-IS2 TaxID=1400762 RepID=A0A9P5XL01_9AGAR|nr:FAS1 domain-containing protein [Macrolepiota fuliginosa MF-IS2]
MSAVVHEGLDSSLLFDDKEECRKKFFRRLVRAILAYESLPEATDIYSLGENSTYATKLAIPGVLEGQALRMRVEQKLLPPSTTVNFYAKVVYPDVKASNGIIHVVNHPVLPPLSAFQTLFMLPDYFSILSSAIQRVGLTHDTDLRFVHKHGKDEKEGHELVGTSSLTLFAPANRAFDRLPLKLKLFLFSPLGHHILRKVLEYHIVPGIIVHSDYQYNKSAHAAPQYVNEAHARYASHGYENIISNRHVHLPTLFDNKTVHAHIMRAEVTLPVPGPDKPTVTKTEFTVNGRDVFIRDFVANNAAVHVVDHLLDPRRDRHHHDCHDNSYQQGQADDGYDNSWEDWEDWLVQWANST